MLAYLNPSFLLLPTASIKLLKPNERIFISINQLASNILKPKTTVTTTDNNTKATDPATDDVDSYNKDPSSKFPIDPEHHSKNLSLKSTKSNGKITLRDK